MALLLLAMEPANAQEEERRGFIGLGIGPSMPFGSFGEDPSNNPEGGRATTGYTSTLVNLGYRFRRHVGLSVAASYSEYPMRGDGDDDWWQVAGVAIGPMYSLRPLPKTGLDLKAMLGVAVLTPVEDSYTTGEGVGTGIGIDLRATFRYDVLRRWALFVEGGVHSSGVSFDSGARTGYRSLISGFGAAFRPAW